MILIALMLAQMPPPPPNSDTASDMIGNTARAAPERLQPAPPPAESPPREVSYGYSTCEDWTRSRYYSSFTVQVHQQRTLVPRRAKATVSEWGRRMEQWAWGYLTASQRYRPLSIPNVVAMRDAIWGELDTYCTAHQGTGFGEALNTLVEDFHRRFRSRQR